MGFEAAPFKMPLVRLKVNRVVASTDLQDYVEIMGGLDSPGYAYFKKLFKEGFEAARKHSDSLLSKLSPPGIPLSADEQPLWNSCRKVSRVDGRLGGRLLTARLQVGLLLAFRPADDSALPGPICSGFDDTSGRRIPGALDRQLDGQQLHEAVRYFPVLLVSYAEMMPVMTKLTRSGKASCRPFGRGTWGEKR